MDGRGRPRPLAQHHGLIRRRRAAFAEEAADGLDEGLFVAGVEHPADRRGEGCWIVDLYTLNVHGPSLGAQQELATSFLRLFMPQMFFYGIVTLATAMLVTSVR